MKKIYFRSNAGLTYGWGHLIRSLTLARYLSQSKGSVQIYMAIEADKAVEKFMGKQDVSSIIFPFDVSLRREENEICKLNPDIIVVDMLKASADLLSLYREYCKKLVVFNDLGWDYRIGDVIVNPQILSSYPRKYGRQKHLNGTKYFVVSEDILNLRMARFVKKVPVKASNLLVIMGGCVQRQLFKKIAQIIDKVIGPGLKIYFALGYDYQIEPNLYKNLKSRGVNFVSGTDKIANLMAQADIALASSGYVKYELAALGIPSLLLSLFDHQKGLAEDFVKISESAEYLGQIRSIKPEKITLAIINLALNQKKRLAMSKAGIKLIDAKALNRIKTELFKI